MFSFVLASVLTKPGKGNLIDEITLLVKPGLPSILEALSHTFVKSSKVLFKNMQEYPKLSKVLFVLSTGGISYINLKVFDSSVINALYM